MKNFLPASVLFITQVIAECTFDKAPYNNDKCNGMKCSSSTECFSDYCE